MFFCTGRATVDPVQKTPEVSRWRRLFPSVAFAIRR